MKLREQSRFSLRALLLACVVVSLPAFSGTLLAPTRAIDGDQPLSRRALSAQDLSRDAIAARGQTFSLKLSKNQRTQLDQALGGNALKVVLPADRVAPFSTSSNRHSSAPAALPIGRAPPRLA